MYLPPLMGGVGVVAFHFAGGRLLLFFGQMLKNYHPYQSTYINSF